MTYLPLRIYVDHKCVDLCRFLEAAFAEIMGISLNLDEVKLKSTAEVEGFGYKKANLDQISALCKEGFGPYEIKVPIYAGISSNAILALFNTCNLDIVIEWKRIVEKHFPTALERDEAFETKKIPEDFLADCSILQRKITDAITALILQEQENKGLDELFNIYNVNLSALVCTVEHQKERLMVRSTGKEDTKELANAGGNTSVSNVIPKTQDIIEAIGLLLLLILVRNRLSSA